MSDDYTPIEMVMRGHYAWTVKGLAAASSYLVGGEQFRDALVEHDRQVAAEAVRAGKAALIDWLIDMGYPFDLAFDAKPPVDGYDLARRWKERDGWDVSDEEAAALIFQESGLVRYAPSTALQGEQEESKA